MNQNANAGCYRHYVRAARLIMLAAWGSIALSGPALAQSGHAATAEADCYQPVADSPGPLQWVEGAEFVMGDDHTYPEESPAHGVQVSGFWMDVHEVTNAQFARFVQETGYVTVAERPSAAPQDSDAPWPPGMHEPGSVVFAPPPPGQALRFWWTWVPGAYWRQPEGPGSSIAGREHYPVVHIAYEDAAAYARWAGRELPTEAQFELAARNGPDASSGWQVNLHHTDGRHSANTWQGDFPQQDQGEDGFRGLAPVGCFGTNRQGIHDLIGNVWEWTSNWYFPGHRLIEPPDPRGPTQAESYSPDHQGAPVRVIKGGSYLCAESYCLRFRPAARQAQETGLGSSHLGFRTVLNSPRH